MMRRVTTPTSQPGPTALRMAGLPPGTPVTGPLRVVFFMPDGVTQGMVPANAMLTTDGRPVYSTGPGAWGQLVAAGRS
jgi:hypothetical protein